MMNCIIYTRVSSDEQSKVGFSIPFQEARCTEHAARLKLTVTERFTEVHSAKTEGRPTFDRMLRFLEEHPGVRIVLVHKLDRLSRNLIDFGTIRDRLGCRVVAVEEPTDDSPQGRLHQNISLSMASYYSDNLAQEVRKGMLQKFEHGGCIARAPLGYRNIPRTRQEKARVEIDAKAGPIVRLLFERYAEGTMSLVALAKEAAEYGLVTRGGLPFSEDYVRRMLKNPFYGGRVHYKRVGETRQGVHQALVSAELFQRVQEMLLKRHRHLPDRVTDKFFLLRGFIYCSCGRRMTGEDHPRGRYYRCMPDARYRRCGARYAGLAETERVVLEYVFAHELTAPTVTSLRVILDGLTTAHGSRRKAEARSLCTKLATLDEDLMRLGRHLADGSLPVGEFRRLGEAIRKEQGLLLARKEELERDVGSAVANLNECIEIASTLRERYAHSLEPEEQKTLLRHIIARVVVDDRLVSRIEFNSPYDVLLGETIQAGKRVDIEREIWRLLSGPTFTGNNAAPAEVRSIEPLRHAA